MTYLIRNWIHFAENNMACVWISKYLCNLFHELDPAPSQPRPIIKCVIKHKNKQHIELLKERSAKRGHLNTIYGTVALTIRAHKLILFPANIILKRNTNKLLILGIKLKPIVAVHLKSCQCKKLQVQVPGTTVLFVPAHVMWYLILQQLTSCYIQFVHWVSYLGHGVVISSVVEIAPTHTRNCNTGVLAFTDRTQTFELQIYVFHPEMISNCSFEFWGGSFISAHFMKQPCHFLLQKRRKV